MNSLFKVSTRFLNTVTRNSEFFISEQAKLRNTLRQFPLTGLQVALCNDTAEAKQFADTLSKYGADVQACDWKADVSSPTGENVLKNVLRKMDIVIDSQLAKELKFSSDEELLKWNTKMIFVKLVENTKHPRSKEEQNVQHLSDVNRILLALYNREHTGVGQVIEVNQA